MANEENTSPSNFIRNIIDEDLKNGCYGGKVQTRFPPEPNGYLHIGHAKAICLNFGIAQDYTGGQCNLRFDDTNPTKEDTEYMESIKRDVEWLGFSWSGELRNASDYYEQFYNYAVELIKKGKAYICELSPEDTRKYRGTLTEAGKDSPYRNRSIEENLDLFTQMKNGDFDEGSRVLRAKIDMSSGNMNMRDPTIYRIRKVRHHRTGNKWCIYPMYDFAHCLSDYIERISHSLCTLEFQDHRPLYDWFLEQLTEEPRPHQYEFARLNLNYTITSKRKLKELVDKAHVNDWDDPRMPTIVGFKRRGYTPASIRAFCERIGVSKKETVIDFGILEDSLREDLNSRAPRAMGVLHPLKLVIENYPEGQEEFRDVANHPKDEEMGKRQIPFSREIYIEQDDFMENPPPKYHRLSPGKEVRLRYSYVVKCESLLKDEKTGAIIEIRCSYDPATLGKKPEGRKVKGIIHWVSANHSIPATIKLYDRLFSCANPTEKEKEGESFLNKLNPESLTTLTSCQLEPSLQKAKPLHNYQFERQGYFCLDPESTKENLIFNRSVTLRDSWSEKK
ncbi:MAG: glutamine--tRNA ligase/YqeY domain fusion protein [Oligoflexales bacterium]